MASTTPTSIFLAGIFPLSKERLLRCSSSIRPEMLPDKESRWLYGTVLQFVDKYGDMPTAPTMRQIVSSTLDAGEAAAVWQIYAGACSDAISEASFQHAIDTLVDNAARNATGEALAVAFEILDTGYQIGSEVVQGHEAAREYLASQMVEISRTGLINTSPELDVREESTAIWTRYHEQKNSPTDRGLLTGLKRVDEEIGGLQKGDLVLVAAFTSHGKSQFSTSVGWQTAVMQGKNVFYATSETSREDITNRFLARHSRLPQFEFPEGLDSKKIRRASLNAAEEKVFKAVLEDLYYNSSYGKFYVSQVPRGSTLAFVENRMLQKHAEWGIDLAIDDYLNLLKPERGRGTQREEASDILKDAKTLATSFGGDGVPFISPWQISRKAYQDAQVSQMYTPDALSEASEAEKSADLIFALLHNSSMDTRRTTFQMLKNRNGPTIPKIELEVDYRNAYFAVGAQASGGGGILQGGGFGR